MAKFFFLGLALACLWPAVSSACALFIGICFALVVGNPYLDGARKLSSRFLQVAVVGLGAGMNLHVVMQSGREGLGYTMAGIAVALSLSFLLGRLFRVERDTTTLIGVGTAICGGSAIAAVAPVIRARPQEVSVALGIVFTLNAIALFIFPPIGHALHLSQRQFGLWCALAIHDTSSVVGAALGFGSVALQIATTVKLARALWIVPLTFAAGWIVRRRDHGVRAGAPKRPWFILGFLATAALFTFVPSAEPWAARIDFAAKRLLVVTLFIIGSTLTRETLRAFGPRALALGITLWLLVAGISLSGIVAGWPR